MLALASNARVLARIRLLNRQLLVPAASVRFISEHAKQAILSKKLKVNMKSHSENYNSPRIDIPPPLPILLENLPNPKEFITIEEMTSLETDPDELRNKLLPHLNRLGIYRTKELTLLDLMTIVKNYIQNQTLPWNLLENELVYHFTFDQYLQFLLKWCTKIRPRANALQEYYENSIPLKTHFPTFHQLIQYIQTSYLPIYPPAIITDDKLWKNYVKYDIYKKLLTLPSIDFTTQITNKTGIPSRNKQDPSRIRLHNEFFGVTNVKAIFHKETFLAFCEGNTRFISSTKNRFRSVAFLEIVKADLRPWYERDELMMRFYIHLYFNHFNTTDMKKHLLVDITIDQYELFKSYYSCIPKKLPCYSLYDFYHENKEGGAILRKDFHCFEDLKYFMQNNFPTDKKNYKTPLPTTKDTTKSSSTTTTTKQPALPALPLRASYDLKDEINQQKQRLFQSLPMLRLLTNEEIKEKIPLTLNIDKVTINQLPSMNHRRLLLIASHLGIINTKYTKEELIQFIHNYYYHQEIPYTLIRQQLAFEYPNEVSSIIYHRTAHNSPSHRAPFTTKMLPLIQKLSIYESQASIKLNIVYDFYENNRHWLKLYFHEFDDFMKFLKFADYEVPSLLPTLPNNILLEYDERKRKKMEMKKLSKEEREKEVKKTSSSPTSKKKGTKKGSVVETQKGKKGKKIKQDDSAASSSSSDSSSATPVPAYLQFFNQYLMQNKIPTAETLAKTIKKEEKDDDEHEGGKDLLIQQVNLLREHRKEIKSKNTQIKLKEDEQIIRKILAFLGVESSGNVDKDEEEGEEVIDVYNSSNNSNNSKNEKDLMKTKKNKKNNNSNKNNENENDNSEHITVKKNKKNKKNNTNRNLLNRNVKGGKNDDDSAKDDDFIQFYELLQSIRYFQKDTTFYSLPKLNEYYRLFESKVLLAIKRLYERNIQIIEGKEPQERILSIHKNNTGKRSASSYRIIGDINGDVRRMLRIYEEMSSHRTGKGKKEVPHYIFLGNIINMNDLSSLFEYRRTKRQYEQGIQGIKLVVDHTNLGCLYLLFLLKEIFPNNITILLGKSEFLLKETGFSWLQSDVNFRRSVFTRFSTLEKAAEDDDDDDDDDDSINNNDDVDNDDSNNSNNRDIANIQHEKLFNRLYSKVSNDNSNFLFRRVNVKYLAKLYSILNTFPMIANLENQYLLTHGGLGTYSSQLSLNEIQGLLPYPEYGSRVVKDFRRLVFEEMLWGGKLTENKSNVLMRFVVIFSLSLFL